MIVVYNSAIIYFDDGHEELSRSIPVDIDLPQFLICQFVFLSILPRIFPNLLPHKTPAETR